MSHSNNGVSVIKKKLFYEISKLKIKGIKSIVLVGSFQYKKQLDRVNDIDLVIVVNALTVGLFRDINKEFKKIGRGLEDKEIKIVIENRIGSYKTKAVKNKKILQLHLLVYEKKLFETLSKTTLYDFTNYNIKLLGKKLIKLKKLTKEDLIFEYDKRMNSLQSGTVSGIFYKTTKSKIETSRGFHKALLTEQLESIVHLVLVSFMNYLRYKGVKGKDVKIFLEKSKQILPRGYYAFYKQIYLVKEEHRKGKKFSKYEIERYKNKALDFLEYLKSQL